MELFCEYCGKPAKEGRRYCQVGHINHIPPKLCECGCGEMTANGGRFIKNHHRVGTISEYSNESKLKMSVSQKKRFVDGNHWANGLTKENDSRIAKSAKAMSIANIGKHSKTEFQSGHATWNRGLTKEDSNIIQSATIKMTAKKKEFFDNG